MRGGRRMHAADVQLLLGPSVLLRQPDLCQLPGDLRQLIPGGRLLPVDGQAAAAGGGTGEGGTRSGRYPRLSMGQHNADLRAGELLAQPAWMTRAQSATTRPEASPYGALDMAGNMGKWFNDWLGWDYYDSSPGSTTRLARPRARTGCYAGTVGTSRTAPTCAWQSAASTQRHFSSTTSVFRECCGPRKMIL